MKRWGWFAAETLAAGFLIGCLAAELRNRLREQHRITVWDLSRMTYHLTRTDDLIGLLEAEEAERQQK